VLVIRLDDSAEQREIVEIDIGTPHWVTERGQARTGRETHVSSTYHGNLGHRMSLEQAFSVHRHNLPYASGKT
jgi:hypothetical protein